MSAPGLRDVIADTLIGLAMSAQADVNPFQLLSGAAALHYAERFEFGDPPAASESFEELADLIDELEAEVQEIRKLVAPSKLAKYDAGREVAP
jgi:hypothetical protein